MATDYTPIGDLPLARRTATPMDSRDARIILLLPVLDFGGIESRAVIQVAGMADQHPGLRVCCFQGAGWAAERIRQLGVPVDVLGTNPGVRNPLATWRLWRYLKQHRPHVIHARSGAMTLHSILAAKAAGTPVRIVEEIGIPDRGRAGRLVFPMLYRGATQVIGVSDAVADYLVDAERAPRDKVRRIYNAIDDRFFASPRGECSRDARRIVTVGRLVPVKGHSTLLNAMSSLFSEQPELRLDVIGDGPERQTLEHLAKRLGISEQTDFLGQRHDVPEQLARSDLFVLPSVQEGFGLALVEAMASGTPIIASRTGGIPELVPQWAEQWLVPPGDVDALRERIATFLRLSLSERTATGNRLRSHAEQFRASQYIRELETLYRESLESVGVE